ncbi:MAG: hypothetical protein H5U06_08965 [Candidatus Aminicenantes bacterium]|nr:hypothetical protein [Candidatus Aminicenantes bacterium]
MKKNIYGLCIWVAVFLTFYVAVIGNRSEAKESGRVSSIVSREDIIKILPQKEPKRKISSVEPVLVSEFDLERIDNPPYHPAMLKVDDDANFYAFDFKQGFIHKFYFSSDWKKLNHTAFGKGIGQGPGEITRLLDFKIFKNELYLLDEGKGAIEIYSTDGNYIRSVRPDNGYVPRKFTVNNSYLVIETLKPAEHLFYAYDLSGKFKFAFGEFIEKKSMENPVYQDNQLSENFSENRFLYLPRFFGFMALYENNKLIMVKETIDGLAAARNNLPQEKSVAKGISAQIVQRSVETVYQYSIYDRILLVRAYDYKKEFSNWDIYNLENLDYLITLKFRPRCNSFALYKDKIAVLSETDTGFKLQIYDIGNILNEVKF